MNEEPSVLDYVKAKLNPRGHHPLVIPPAEELAPQAEQQRLVQPKETIPAPPAKKLEWPWASLVALLLALVAQTSLEPSPNRTWIFAALIFGAAVILLVWANLHQEWQIAPLRSDERSPEPYSVHANALLFGLPVVLVAFLLFGGNKFTVLNLLVWYFAIMLFIRAFWLGPMDAGPWLRRLGQTLRQTEWRVRITRWTILIVGVAVLALFFRAYLLNQIPAEMNSDHAEKLLDVWDVLHGQTRIFFPRNTGREAIQFYLTAGVALIFKTGVSFLSLKIGTLIAGLITLPYIYLLGKEVANREVGLWAALFAGIAYWPNVITRMALRFTLYPLFVAPTLYYLVRGIRRSNRNDFILAGIALGIGLHGYTPIRILPFVVVAAVGIYLIHRQAQGVRKDTILHLGLLSLFSVVLFLPLMRFALENPDLFAYRSFTRLTTLERPLPGPMWQIFLHNLGNAMLMFNWDNGEVWTTSIPHRPALGIVTGAFFVFGMVLLLVRYLRQRHWLDLFLILSVPLLMMPSILSLAFPSENPSLSRGGGALVTVFVIIAIAVQSLLQAVRTRLEAPLGTRLALGLAVLLVAWSAAQNYDLVFNQYATEYRLSAWNTSEMGRVIRDFADTIGSADSAWVVGYPYWVDTRLVGMNAGYPDRDMVIMPDQLDATKAIHAAKLFLVKPEDEATLQHLNILYPQGTFQDYHSQTPTKDFVMFFVPPQ